MKLFGKKTIKESSGSTDVPGLADAAAARGWQPVDGVPLASELADQVHGLAWILHGRQFSTAIYDTNSVRHSTVYHDAYRGEAGAHPLVVANAWTNIGPQQVVKLLEMTGIAVCAVERCKLPPLQVQPGRLPPLERLVGPTPTGDTDFDARFVTKAPFPGSSDLFTDDVRRRISAHDDWAFLCMSGTLLCASTGPFASADAVAARVDEVLALVAAMEAEVVPVAKDDDTAALLARVAAITNLDDALALLLGLTPHEREVLAASDTPLAPFANVTTPDQALETLQSLDMTQRMRVLAMMNLTDEGL